MRAAWWQEQQDEACTVPWLSLKAKIEPEQNEGQIMSGDWREVTPSLWGF
jgi:hypothetical protein